MKLLIEKIIFLILIKFHNASGFACKTFRDRGVNNECTSCWTKADGPKYSNTPYVHFTAEKMQNADINDPFTLKNGICFLNCQYSYWTGISDYSNFDTQDDQACVKQI